MVGVEIDSRTQLNVSFNILTIALSAMFVALQNHWLSASAAYYIFATLRRNSYFFVRVRPQNKSTFPCQRAPQRLPLMRFRYFFVLVRKSIESARRFHVLLTLKEGSIQNIKKMDGEEAFKLYFSTLSETCRAAYEKTVKVYKEFVDSRENIDKEYLKYENVLLFLQQLRGGENEEPLYAAKTLWSVLSKVSSYFVALVKQNQSMLWW